jgi:hypothetical protein
LRFPRQIVRPRYGPPLARRDAFYIGQPAFCLACKEFEEA